MPARITNEDKAICFLNINVIVHAELIDKVKQSTGFSCRNSKYIIDNRYLMPKF